MIDKIIEELEKQKIKIKTVNGFLSQKQGFYNSVIEKSIEIVKKHDNDGWISVKDKLPIKADSYQVTKRCLQEGEEDYIDEVCSEIFWTRDNTWDSERDEYCEWKVVAWKLLPKPYKGE